MKNMILIAAGLAAGLLSVPSVRAQSFSLDWFTIDGGGGSSSGGVYSLSGTIGQPDANNVMTGGSYALTGGFWALYAEPTPRAPLLTIAHTTTNTIAISWPSPSPGFDLQVNTNGPGTVNWSNAPGIIQDDSTRKTLIVSPLTGNRFYRLLHP